jgi:hypothetical protein
MGSNALLKFSFLEVGCSGQRDMLALRGLERANYSCGDRLDRTLIAEIGSLVYAPPKKV